MRIIAFYLPQFHRVKENDLWWGEGYTEWTAVRNAESYFPGHKQPRIPLGGEYYDLLSRETFLRQEKLMHEYGIYGLCLYHYWFKNGRKILEKPVENLLKWKEIGIRFCFSWANVTWARSWSKISDKNEWNIKQESAKGNGSDILLEQDYGDETAWREHFYYLLPFFLDERYIKFHGRPVFLLFKPDEIVCLVKMIHLWNELALEHGLKGIYFIGTNSTNPECDAMLCQEPSFTIWNYPEYCNDSIGKMEKIFEYGELIKRSVSDQATAAYRERVYYSTFCSYDDTPRRGRYGTAVVDSSPKAFGEYLSQVLDLSKRKGNEYLFINAFNEWGEGMYLEPDEENGYGYLEVIKQVVSGEVETGMSVEDFISKDIRKIGSDAHLYKKNWKLLDRWLSLKEQGKNLADFLLKRNVRTIAVYGLGMMGIHFLKELDGAVVEIKYAIDIRWQEMEYDFPVYDISHDLPEADAVIVTVIRGFGGIYESLRKKGFERVFALDEIIEELFKEEPLSH